MQLPRLLATLTLGLAALGAQAHSFQLGAIAIGHPWARATVAGQTAGGGFLTLHNTGPDDRLLAASTERAQAVELHVMATEGDVMRMRPVEAIALPTGQTVELKPGGLHLMLIGLKAPLQQGGSFPLKLRFEKAGELTVQVKVEAAGASRELKR